MKGASVLETKKNAGRMARLGVLAALLIAAAAGSRRFSRADRFRAQCAGSFV